MGEANSVSIPADEHRDLSLQECGLKDDAVNVPYKEAVESLLFLATVSRPDIAFAVNSVSQYVKSPKKIHWNAIQRILKYVRGTVTHGILFPREHENLRMNAYSDADFAGGKQTRKSTNGLIIKFADPPIIWGSQKQKSVASSMMESEYIAASQASKEHIWLSRLINELVKRDIEVPIMYIDNQSVIRFIKNPQITKNSKHIEVRYHFVWDNDEKKIFALEYVSADEQLADILTKPLSKTRFEYLRGKINVIDEIKGKPIIDMST